MPINPKYKSRYEFGKFYHVFNRASGKQLLFREDENYQYFLARFNYYLGPYLQLHAWCLIPNHFHFLVQVKERRHMPKLPRNVDINRLLSLKFKNFFLSYSMSYKIRYDQASNVFSQKYKHIQVYTEIEIRRVVLYIHRNPKHHHVGNWKTYKWSSYNELITQNKKQDNLVLELFGGREEYLKIHEMYMGKGIDEGSEPLKGSEPSSS